MVDISIRESLDQHDASCLVFRVHKSYRSHIISPSALNPYAGGG